MINNIELIKPLLNFSEEGDFYMLYVLKRKKDQVDKDNHQSVRTIKAYCIESVEYLEKRYEEIKTLCEMFKARAYIHVQKQNHADVSLEMMMTLAQRIKDKHHVQTHLFDTVVGQMRVREKRWIVDVDTLNALEIINTISKIDDALPEGPKLQAIIPTRNGVHLITHPFDTRALEGQKPLVEIQKKNPTLLYYPQSLEDESNIDKETAR